MSPSRLGLAVLITVTASCGREPAALRDAGHDLDAGSDAGPADPDALCPPLYHQDVFPTFEMEISKESWEALEAEFLGPYVRPVFHPLIAFRYGDDVTFQAHVRLKERRGPPKMQLVFSFNQTDPDGRFLGLRRIALDAPPIDPSFLRERLALSVFRSVGLPAACANNARLLVNGEYYGLFVNIERVDHEFLERNYGRANADGNLYQDAMELVTNEETGDMVPLQAFLAADDLAAFDAVGDVDQWLQEWATEMILPESDGFLQTNHNFFVYDHPTRGFLFIPHDKDYAIFMDASFSIAERPLVPSLGILPGSAQNRITILLGDPGRFAQYVGELSVARRAYEPSVLQARVDEWSEQIATAVAEDPRLPFPIEDHHTIVAGLREYVAARAKWVDTWLACARAEPDRAHDDCPDCYESRLGGRDYVLCRRPRTWDVAVAECEARGATLVAPRNDAEHQALYSHAFQTRTPTWWLGITDQDHEGTFTDLAGEPVGYTAFAPGEPDDDADQNCVLLNELGQWEDRRCTETYGAVCAPKGP